MNEQFAISDRDEAAGFGDQPEYVSPFARSFPYRPGKRAMAPKDKAEGEVA
nr:L370 [uncultured bacterium]